MPVSQLMKLLGMSAPAEALAGQQSRTVPRPINPETKIVDLTVGELLQLVATGRW